MSYKGNLTCPYCEKNVDLTIEANDAEARCPECHGIFTITDFHSVTYEPKCPHCGGDIVEHISPVHGSSVVESIEIEDGELVDVNYGDLETDTGYVEDIDYVCAKCDVLIIHGADEFKEWALKQFKEGK